MKEMDNYPKNRKKFVSFYHKFQLIGDYYNEKSNEIQMIQFVREKQSKKERSNLESNN
jgi:hypothetical protein